VEGETSGGERSSACLALRIALAFVLTQNLSWIILDEPTHNIDRRGVRELAITLREHLPGIVEQIFLITHNQELESAASAYLYILERDKDANEATRVVKEREGERVISQKAPA
jgi:exonuclease SbcC